MEELRDDDDEQTRNDNDHRHLCGGFEYHY